METSKAISEKSGSSLSNLAQNSEVLSECEKKPRPKDECEEIIKAIEEIRIDCFVHRDGIFEDSESYILEFKDMKPFFNNQDDVEDDIQEYIKITIEGHNDVYHQCMREIVWTLDFLLSYPNVSIAKEIEDLKKFIKTISNTFWEKDYYFQGVYDKMYQENLFRQLPKEIQREFEQRNKDDYYVEIDNENTSYLWLPFEDPTDWYWDNYEDEFVTYLEMIRETVLCKGCGKRFNGNSILKHLGHPKVKCRHYFTPLEVQALQNHAKISTNEKQKNYYQNHTQNILEKQKMYKHSKNIHKLERQQHIMDNQPNFSERKRQLKYNAISISYEIKGKWSKTFRSYFELDELRKLFIEKCQLQKRERLIYLDFDFGKFKEIKSHCLNEKEVEEDILSWKFEIEAEINETFDHLKIEIETSHLKGYSNDNIRYNVESLQNYVSWRLKNSQYFILQNLIMLCKRIKCQLPIEYHIQLPYTNSETPEPKEYETLIDFKEEKKKAEHANKINSRIKKYIDDIKIPLKIYESLTWERCNEEITKFSENKYFPKELLLKCEEAVKRCTHAFEELKTEKRKVIVEVYDELGPEETWIRSDQQSYLRHSLEWQEFFDLEYVFQMAANFEAYLSTEEVRIVFDLYDTIHEIVSKVGDTTSWFFPVRIIPSPEDQNMLTESEKIYNGGKRECAERRKSHERSPTFPRLPYKDRYPSFAVHIKVPTTPHKCDLCGEEFLIRTNLVFHIKKKWCPKLADLNATGT